MLLDKLHSATAVVSCRLAYVYACRRPLSSSGQPCASKTDVRLSQHDLDAGSRGGGTFPLSTQSNRGVRQKRPALCRPIACGGCSVRWRAATASPTPVQSAVESRKRFAAAPAGKSRLFQSQSERVFGLGRHMSSPRMNATGSTVSTYGLSPRALLPFFKARGPRMHWPLGPVTLCPAPCHVPCPGPYALSPCHTVPGPARILHASLPRLRDLRADCDLARGVHMAAGPPEVDKATMQRRGQYDAREGQIVIDKGPSIVAVADKDNDGIVTKAEFSHWHWR